MQGGATGTGTVSLVAPVTNTNRTINLPDSNGTIVTSATAGVPINGPAFSAYQSSSQSVTTATYTKVLFQTEEFDTNSNFASSTFTPTVAGYYQINSAVRFSSVNSTMRLALYKNGVVHKLLADSGGTSQSSNHGGCVVYLNGSTDYIEIYVYLSTTTGLGANAAETYFNSAMVRSAT
tara:strand:- start:122 stop:655 length:534 start_codon:yes stop_codon:yes gene_type:complete